MFARDASVALALASSIGAAGCYQAHERGAPRTIDAATSDALADDRFVITGDASVIADNLALLVRLDGHVYRVHVWSSTPPTMVFSFDQVG